MKEKYAAKRGSETTIITDHPPTNSAQSVICLAPNDPFLKRNAKYCNTCSFDIFFCYLERQAVPAKVTSPFLRLAMASVPMITQRQQSASERQWNELFIPEIFDSTRDDSPDPILALSLSGHSSNQ
jgi:hypothetical protein